VKGNSIVGFSESKGRQKVAFISAAVQSPYTHVSRSASAELCPGVFCLCRNM